ncbi:MAG: enoyl-CoA hydratase/isomerase family protein [Pseudomonadota bacterium]
MSVLLSEASGPILTLTLNRPEVHNAFNAALIAALHDAFSAPPETARVIILKGTGKSFCAGGDLNWMREAAGYSHAENVADANRLSDMLDAVYRCPIPVIADVHGAAYGGGVGLVACADIAVADPSSKFMLSEVRLGLTPATISPYVLDAMGARAARRYFVTAEGFGAEEALACGLVHLIGGDATALAEKIAANGPKAVRAAKALIQDIAGQSITDDLRAQTAQRIADRRASDEGREGIAAFLEKRSPRWRDG